MQNSTSTLTPRHITVLGASVAAAWALTVMLTHGRILASPLRLIAVNPMQPPLSEHGVQLLLPVLAYLLPGSLDGCAWLVNTIAMWGTAVLIGVWSIRERAGVLAAVLVCLACVLAPQMRGQLITLWSTYCLLWFSAVLAAYCGRWKHDLTGSIALTGAAACHPTLWIPVLAIWAAFRLPGSGRDQWPQFGLVVVPGILVLLGISFVWYPSTFHPGWEVQVQLGGTFDPLQWEALQDSGNLSTAHFAAILVDIGTLGAFITPLIPLAVLGAVTKPELRWPFSALIAVFAAVVLTSDQPEVAFLAAPVVFPAAACGLRRLTGGKWTHEMPAAVVMGVSYLIWPLSLELTLCLGAGLFATYHLILKHNEALPE